MPFSMPPLAHDYVERRFPKATALEKEKIIQDWINKPKKSQALVDGLQTHLGDLQKKSVLDIGSGNGGLSLALARAGANVTGLDVEPELRDIAERHAEAENIPATFVLYDGRHMPFTDETFDLCVSVSVLEHVDEPVTVLREAFRVLKPGGIFFLALPNRLWPKETHSGLWGITYLPYTWASWIVNRLGHSPLQDNNLHFYTYWDLRRFLNILAQEGHRIDVSLYSDTVRTGWKSWIKTGLRMIGIPHQALLPHLMFVLRKM